MPSEKLVTEENFRLLLKWLDADGDAAGEKYESIRQRLIRIFVCRGCHDAEALADNTIDRVILKAPTIAPKYVGEPALYFYGVGNKIYLEWLRKQRELKRLNTPLPSINDDDSSDPALECLETCLADLSGENRALIVKYYEGEKSVRIRSRKELGRTLGISEAALQIRASRIRAMLRNCVRKCMDTKRF